LLPSAHSGGWDGALVASLRSHILRPVAASIAGQRALPNTFSLPPVVAVGYNYRVLRDSVGRFCGVPHWPVFRCPPRDVLIVAARTTLEEAQDAEAFGDGVLTSRRTFQKFYAQSELQDYIRQTLEQEPVAVAPGVFFLFRQTAQRESYLSANARRASTAPKARRTERVYAEHQTALDALAAFVTQHGRLPTDDDAFDASEIAARLGSVKRAFLTLKRVFSPEHWLSVAEGAKQDLLVYLALAKFRGRSKFQELDVPLQRDIKGLFGSYVKACSLADNLLFSAGDHRATESALSTSPVGKLTPGGLYVHRSALTNLPPLLRVYEGCARVLVGEIEGANIIKLHRSRFAVSYLYYPDFESDAHPALAGSVIVYLASRDVRFRDYSESDNPPILHRKETFVADGYPQREIFGQLTEAEEELGLYEDTTKIGTRQGWTELLREKQVVITGHSVRFEPTPSA
jgi:DNA phosphorothioation-associated putative methyltransferase